MQKLFDMMTICKEVQKTQQELEVVATAMKGLPLMQQMTTMGEKKKLQGELQKLHTWEDEYLEIVL